MFSYKYGIALAAILLFASPVMANDWFYKGAGGWRTDDGRGGWVLNDRGYNVSGISVGECQSRCLTDAACKGIEYVADATPVCEIHHDPFRHCDEGAGVGGRAAPNGCWVRSRWQATWQPLGGILTSAPAAVYTGGADTSRNLTRMSVFVRGTDNALWQRKWDGSRWSDWENLGGVLSSAPTAVSRAADRVDVFVRGTDNQLWQRSWDGTRWSAWQQPVRGTLTSAPSCASNAANSIHCFARGGANQLVYTSWDGIRWGDWRDLGGVLADAPAAAVGGDLGAMAFVRATNNELMYKHQLPSGGWSDWLPLGGILTAAPSATANARYVDVFVRGTDNALWHKRRDSTGRWGDWQRRGGVLSEAPGCALSNPNTGRLDCFVRGTDNQLWQLTRDQ